jgi:hypothetical protein
MEFQLVSTKKPMRLIASAAYLSLLGSLAACGLGGGYQYVEVNSVYKVIEKSGNPVVDNLVVDFKYNGDFIVALRLKAIALNCSGPNESLDAYRITNDMEYWIINKDTNEVFSTQNELEYIDRRRQLKVPDDLLLDKGTAADALRNYRNLGGDEFMVGKRCVAYPPRGKINP